MCELDKEYKIAYAYLKGESHELANLPCQDSIFGMHDDNKVCVVLADGAGSMPNSEYASNYVTNTLVNDFFNNTYKWIFNGDESLKERIIELTERQIVSETQDKHADCTMLLFGQYKDESLIVHIGDGIVLGVSDETTDVLSWPENGQAINETFFLSGKQAKSHLRIYRNIDNKYKTIILSSDGAESVLYNMKDNKEAMASRKMASWLVEANEQEATEALENAMNNVIKNNTNDDISIAIIKRSI